MVPPLLVVGGGLVLVGYRGTGKSTVGCLVAEAMNRKFLDVDVEIEAQSGQSIAAIFAQAGESGFRDWEERTLAVLLESNPTAVVATGGGSVMREQNRRRLQAFGHIVWLTADPDELARRLLADERSQKSRPALTSVGLIDEIATVLTERTPIYKQLADTVIETGAKSPEQVAAAVLESVASGNSTGHRT